MAKKVYLLLFWTAFVFFLIATPLPEYDGDIETLYDKVAHVFLFGIFAFLLAFTLAETRFKIWLILFFSFLGGILYSALCELIQAHVPGRDVSEYDFIAGIIGVFLSLIFSFLVLKLRKPKLLLHICCVGCGVYISRILKKKYNITLYFYNPNIFPEDEYIKRLTEAKRIARRFNLKLITEKYDHASWQEKVRGWENEPERGGRCLICYEDRLRQTAAFAKKNNFSIFTTTLTTSPHKVAEEIFRIGRKLAREYDRKFLDQDFKKQDGFKKSSELARELGLYRQNYCGCEFSQRS